MGGPAASAGDGAAGEFVPRIVLGLYDGSSGLSLREQPLHQMLQTPLEHLGLVLEPHDVNEPLPEMAKRDDVRGVLTWFNGPIQDPSAYMDWANAALDAELPYVIFGNPGFIVDDAEKMRPDEVVDDFLRRLKLRRLEPSYDPTYLSRAVIKVSPMVEYERRLPQRFPVAGAVEALDPQARIYLRSGREGTNWAADLVFTGPQTSLVSEGFTHYSTETSSFRQWLIDPFTFLEEAFQTASVPKPDVTTAVGRRLYFSHIDGDGWRNWPDMEPYRRQSSYAIDAIIDRVIEPYPDLPVTVAPIAADLDADWCGDAATQAAARRVFALPQVEPASHTYSHPFFWRLFEHGSPGFETFGDPGCFGGNGGIAAPKARAFLKTPFDLDQEIAGAARYIETLSPPEKTVELLQWSGDTSPTASMLKAVREAGMLSINGGDARFDSIFPSVSWVSPLSLTVGEERQIYAAASNENTYTNLWTRRFYSFLMLRETLENTESPRRLKPINLYYHVYSGERLASLSALIDNLEFARSQEIAPIRTSDYVRMAEGFYSTRLVKLAPRSWRVEDRGSLQTLRFDKADGLNVDDARSSGVLGWRRHQGSLYVALDPADLAPLVTLAPAAGPSAGPARPFLVHGRWLVESLRWDEGGFAFEAGGFGRGEFLWQVPSEGVYEVFDEGRPQAGPDIVATGPDGTLRIDLAARAPEKRTIQVRLRPSISTQSGDANGPFG